MTIKHLVILLIISIEVFLGVGAASAAISFVPGHYYASPGSSNTITQYNGAGNVVGSLTLSLGNEVRGLTFGPDNLLYATVVTSSSTFSIVALNSAGVAQQTYSGNIFVNSNASYGKIAIAGQYLYMAGSDYLTRFLLGNPSSGTSIYTNNQVFDVKPLPNGRLLVASNYQIQEITDTGSVIRTISLTGAPSGYTFSSVRGIEYNATTNDLFVSQYGSSLFPDRVLRLDATTGMFERDTTFYYTDDLFLTASGELLVGSRFETPTFYSQDLNARGPLQSGQRMFVTQYVPEPSIVGLLAASGGTLLLRRRR